MEIPRPLIRLAWAGFLLVSAPVTAGFMLIKPDQPWQFNLILGLSTSIGVYTWLIFFCHLNGEIFHMIFSKGANERDIRNAEARKDAAVLEWYEQHKDQLPEGLPLPPGVTSTDATLNGNAKESGERSR